MSDEFERLMATYRRIERGLDSLLERHKPPPLERHHYRWYEHHTYSKTMCDGKFLDMVAIVCDQKLKEHGNFVLYNRGWMTPEVRAIRRKFSKLSKIIKLEHELCGEEDW
jgi:hypothetical protein